MLPHDWLDSFGCLVRMVERNGGNIVMKDVSFNDAVQELTTDEAKFAINSGSSTTNVVPSFGRVMGQRWVGVLKIRNSH